MEESQKLYFDSFIAMSEAMEDIYEALAMMNKAIETLKQSQLKTEELFISSTLIKAK